MDKAFPIPVDTVLSTIKSLFHHQGNEVITEFLEQCSAKIIEDDDTNSYNNDPSIYSVLLLEAPPAVYAKSEGNIERIEEAISEKLSSIRKGTGIHQLYKARVTVQMRQASNRAEPREDKVSHIWEAGKVRLFMSHLTADKVQVKQLKDELALFGVSGFVAHADIEPTLEWGERNNACSVLYAGIGSSDH